MREFLKENIITSMSTLFSLNHFMI